MANVSVTFLKGRGPLWASQLMRFAGVGIVATGVHLSIAAAILVSHEQATEYLANVGGFVGAVGVSYYGHSRYTFRRSGSFARLLAVAVGGFVFNNVVLAALVETGLLAGWIAITVSTLAVPACVFVALKTWAFRTHTP